MKPNVTCLACERCGKQCLCFGHIAQQIRMQFVKDKTKTLCEGCTTSEEKVTINQQVGSMLLAQSLYHNNKNP